MYEPLNVDRKEKLSQISGSYASKATTATSAAEAERVRVAPTSAHCTDAPQGAAGEQPVFCDCCGTIAPANANRTPASATREEDWAAVVDAGLLCKGSAAGVDAADGTETPARSTAAEGGERADQARHQCCGCAARDGRVGGLEDTHQQACS